MKDIAVFAQTTFRNEARRFGIKTDDRRRHMYLIGKTGMGKSTILENMIVDDIRAGHGVAIVDPHGDLAEKIIEYVPTERIKDVIYFNPSDQDFPIAFNIVEQVEPHLRHLVASGLIGVFQKLWADSWGPRLEYILRNAILAILDFPGSTILGVVRMLSDKNYRKRVVANIKDPVVKAFWEKEFAGYADKFASEAVSPIQNKVGQFLSSSLMRNIIGQVKSSIDIREVMDNGKILIMNLSKGRIGEDNSALLGAMMITKIQLAAMSRVDILEKDRRDFYLYIDEFQNFSTDSFANILSEARKYRLNLILAHQYIEQLSEKVKPAVFGNVGTMVVFRVGAADAEELVKEFTPTFTEEDIVNLPKYEMYLKLMIDGVASAPFSAKGLPPLRSDEKTGNVEKVIAETRKNYASDRASVEEKIMRWHEGVDEPTSPDEIGVVIQTQNIQTQNNIQSPVQQAPGYAPQAQVYTPQAQYNTPQSQYTPQAPVRAPYTPQIQGQQNSYQVPVKDSYVPQTQVSKAQTSAPLQNKSGFEAKCASCSQITYTPFQPDGIRPVYCKDCLSKRREEKRIDLEKRQADKKEEKIKFEKKEEPAKKTDEPWITLDDLKNLAPVDFRGKTMNRPAPVVRREEVDNNSARQENQISSLNNPQEMKLNEGEEVVISQNRF